MLCIKLCESNSELCYQLNTQIRFRADLWYTQGRELLGVPSPLQFPSLSQLHVCVTDQFNPLGMHLPHTTTTRQLMD